VAYGIFKDPLFVQLTIPLVRSQSQPLSRQIYLWIRQSILDGGLPVGGRLPSTRDLADQLNVSRTVTVLAFDDLLAEGFVEGRGGSGTYVAAAPAVSPPPFADPASAAIRLSRFGHAAQASVLPRSGPAGVGRLPYDFVDGRHATAGPFPLVAWRRMLARNARAVHTAYADPAGSEPLREAIAAHLRRSRAVVCEASQVVIVNGSQQALDLAARVLIEPGDTVAIEDPHYSGAREVFRAAGAKLASIPVDRDGLVTDRLPKRARAVFVTPSHQFPSGAILPLQRRLALLDWARRAKALIIEDDYDGEFHYEGRHVESLQGLDREGRVLYTGTFSRTIFPALRLGYLIAPRALAAAFASAKWLCDRHAATLEQETLAEFIATGAYARYLRRSRKENATLRAALADAVRKHIGDLAELSGEDSGTHAILWPRARRAEAHWIAAAASRGVRVSGVGHCYFEQRPRPGLMLAYTKLPAARIREGIKRLAAAISDGTGRRAGA
jgi:GntR family transcriptional regulator/MocR family aminotransferase